MSTRLPVRSLIAASLAGLCAAAALASGPGGIIGHWALDEPAGAIMYDTSGNGNNGLFPQYLPRVAGVSDLAAQLGMGYAIVNDNPSLNPVNAITISAWYRATIPWAGAGNDPIVDKPYVCHCGAPYYQYHLGVTGTEYGVAPRSISFTTAGGGSVTSPPGIFELGEWHHYVATSDANASRLYVDGTLVATGPGTGPIPSYGRPIYIGRYGNLLIYLQGNVDEIQIYDRALTCREVKYLHEHPGSHLLTIDTTPADLDGDGVVGGSDLGILLGSWGPCAGDCGADLDCSGSVDGSDLGIMLGSWS
ncbi:MAG: LamG domain-containing protein [Phycisphaerales bacterium]